MLFTDGGEERAQSILEKYNADKKVQYITAHRFLGKHNVMKQNETLM